MSVTVTGELEELYKEMVTNPLHSKDFIENGLSKLKLILRDPSNSDITPEKLEFKSRPTESGPKGWHKINSSMITVGVIVFVGDTSRGILFPILSTLCTQLGGTVVDLGYLVAMFSIGRLLVTAPLGYVSDRYRHRLPLLISSLILVLGAILWANAFLAKRISALYAAQFLLGVGSGSLGITRSFVVEQCDPSKRTQVLALITALQYAGFTISPIIGSWLVTLGGRSSIYWSYALPAYLIAFMASWCFFALLFEFKDINAEPVVFANLVVENITDKEDDLRNNMAIAELNEKADTIGSTASPTRRSVNKYSSPLLVSGETSDIESVAERSAGNSKGEERSTDEGVQRAKNGLFCVIISMFLLNVATKGSISVYETLGAKIGLVDYHMSPIALGALISCSGIVGFIQLLLFPRVWTKNLSGDQSEFRLHLLFIIYLLHILLCVFPSLNETANRICLNLHLTSENDLYSCDYLVILIR